MAARRSTCRGTTRIPPGTADHAARALKESSRHGEWADVKLADGGGSRAGSSIPNAPQKAGVVLVIHDIRGMSDMARALGDQLAQDGFIAIVPDFLSGKGPNGGGTESLGQDVGKTIQSLTPADVDRAPERGDGVRQEAAGRRTARPASSASAGAARAASATPRPSRR